MWVHVPTYPPNLVSLPLDSPTLGHWAFTGSRISSSMDVQKGYLLQIRLKPCVTICVILGCYFQPWDLWWVDIVVLPMELPTLSAPSVLSLPPQLVHCVQFNGWLWASASLCQALIYPFRRQLYQDPFSMRFLASKIMSVFGDCIWGEFSRVTVSG